MKIIQQLFIASCILTSQLIQTAYLKNFDHQTYESYVKKAEKKLDVIHDEVQFEKHGPREILWSGKECADIVYPQQKTALNAIIEELKELDLQNNDENVLSLSQRFKTEIYDNWKREFKNNYEISLKSKDVWGWLHQSKNFPIHE